MKVVQLKCVERKPGGTGSARAVRRAGDVPAVVYGEGQAPEHVQLPGKAFRSAVDAGARVIDLERGAAAVERVLLQDVQFDAMGLHLVHADFRRMNPDHEVTLRVPIVFDGVPKGLADGGVLTVQRDVLEIRCLPRDIPEGLTVSVAELALGDSIEAGKVPLPAGVKLAEKPHDVVVTCALPKVEKAATPADGAAAAEGAAAPAAGDAAKAGAPAAGAAGGAAPAKGDAKPAAGAKAPAKK